MENEQTTLPVEERRDALEAAFDAVVETPVVEKPRDEIGRFAEKTNPEPTIAPAPSPDEMVRPTTWKKEYLPLWDKMASGATLTPDEAKQLAKYSNQRETEYKTGVSTYKERADRAQGIEKAIEPFMPELQRNNIPVDQWISNLGRAHHTLALGTPEQKLQMFQKLAQDYGIPLGAVQQAQNGQQVDPAMMQIIDQFNQLRGQVQSVTNWREQENQRQTQQAISVFANDAVKYPHFEKLKPTMAQLLETGLAQDLETAYKKAERMDDEVWSEVQASQSQAANAQANSRQVVAKAKANAISVKSSTPTGQVQGAAKDRRTTLTELVGAMDDRV